MKRLATLAGLLALFLQVALGQSANGVANAKRNAQVDTVLQRLGRGFMAQPARVGLSVGIIKDGQTYFYNFGEVEKGKGQAPTQRTVYEIASISKTFASLLLAQAIIEQRVKATDDIRKYLGPTYANLAYQGQPIRLIHLANTTSALPDNLPDLTAFYKQVNPDSVAVVANRKLKNYTKQNFYEDLRRVKPDTIPGVVPRHSNVATQLLAYILEGVYQAPYQELLAKYIEKPCGMQDAHAFETEASLLATGYNENGSHMANQSIATMQASGGLRYSVANMVKYLHYQLNERTKAVALTHQPTWGTPEGEAIGYNWNIAKTVDSKRTLFHSGGSFGFASHCAFYPELGLGIVLLTNESDRNTQASLYDLSDQIVQGIYGTPAALKAFQQQLLAQKYEQAAAIYKAVKAEHREFYLPEEYVNEWGYKLARAGKTQPAIALFKLNAVLYPKSWNTYDSLGEAYEIAGNKPLAVANYQRSLTLNPKNAGAVEHLKKLGQTTSK
ncbi:serine hydrolase domain-containing protein [Hymenobacter crusticola]|uniref:Serine hydrolase n=1 Tax=Hymenobacter crusticola TaxID=1770526 RepID=A0A243WHE8_9BACT|nr:serine hydrolase domain-containing protein [Hymenobacter crusticola]OUJ74907.1 serine hydrolase [Hymenobacter crusticola]